jgi:hypothetical protein
MLPAKFVFSSEVHPWCDSLRTSRRGYSKLKSAVQNAIARNMQTGRPDRTAQAYVSLNRLPMPQMYEGARLVKISPDERLALCYECHAPAALAQITYLFRNLTTQVSG